MTGTEAVQWLEQHGIVGQTDEQGLISTTQAHKLTTEEYEFFVANREIIRDELNKRRAGQEIQCDDYLEPEFENEEERNKARARYDVLAELYYNDQPMTAEVLVEFVALRDMFEEEFLHLRREQAKED